MHADPRRNRGTPRLLVAARVHPARPLDLMAPLEAALAGTGPAVLPVSALDPAVPGVGPDGTAVPGAPVPGPLDPAESPDDDPTAVVLATSGSTGVPKGALLPASAMVASATATHTRLGGPGTWLLALPAHHVAGVQVLVRSLVAGTVPAVADLGAGATAAALAAAARATRGARRYTALVPTQVRRVLDDPAACEAFAAFDAVLVGGAALPPDLHARALAAGVPVVTTYGMSETSGGCVYDGVPLPGVHVAADAQGRLSLTGAVVARGYRCRPGHPDFTTTADGVRTFTTADLGRRDGTGPHARWVVLGRADDVIVSGGLKISPAVVEAALVTLPWVADAVVVPRPSVRWGQEVVAFVTVRRGAAAPADPLPEVRDHVGARLGRPVAPGHVEVLDRLPLTGPGKPDRRALRARAAGSGGPWGAGARPGADGGAVDCG